MTDTLHGRAVIVTGGGTGIGRVTAWKFADEGADVLVVGRTEDRLKETAGGRPGIRTVVADVAAPDAPERIVAAATEAFGRIDVLVNNAAITRPAPLGEIIREIADRQLATNLLGPLFLAQEALPHLECLDQPGAGDGVCLESDPAITRKLAALDEEITALVRMRDRLAVQLRRARGESTGAGDDTTDPDDVGDRHLNRGVRRDRVQEVAGDIAAR
ncbi:SDR family NAD(P)-dependent oxidoreductase [Actinoallomurus sp. NPDC050550]|uniref:SDR family NAD(P)-dependent oxidoreductase n=1 Tax=Actinoallomurus sp. NPDC050550 TaxID=3154937 RepID=UPI0033F89955